MKDSGIYISKDGIVGYSLVPDIMLDDPRNEDFGNISTFSSFDGFEGDYFSYISSQLKKMTSFEDRKKLLLKHFDGLEYLRGIKKNPETNILELCEVDDATYGLIALDEDFEITLNEEDILKRFSDELKEYSYYLEGQQYSAVKYSFDGDFIEGSDFLYGLTPEETNMFYVLGKPIKEETLVEFNEPWLDVEDIIQQGVFLDNEMFFDLFLEEFKGTELFENIYEFELEEVVEAFNKNEFISELFDFLKRINKKDSEVVEFICKYLIEKVKEIAKEFI